MRELTDSSWGESIRGENKNGKTLGREKNWKEGRDEGNSARINGLRGLNERSLTDGITN